VNSYAKISGSILFDGVSVGRGAILQRAIVDKDVEIPEGEQIGVDPIADAARGLTVTEAGIVVVPRGFQFRREDT
jgi:glucose-1-phosphate adenylyltransferase